MIPVHKTDQIRRRWLRRLAATSLLAMVTGLVGVAALAAWVVSETVPVIVVDEFGHPVSGAMVFEMDEALNASPRRSRGHVNLNSITLCGGCLVGSAMPCVPVSPQLDVATASPIDSGQATSAGTTPGSFAGSPSLVVLSPPPQTPPAPVSPIKARVLKWLHPFVQPFGVALVWDWERPVYTGGAGEVRVPESIRLTVLSPGELRFEPGQVFAVEQIAPGAKGFVPPARFVLRPMKPPPAALEKRVYWSCIDASFCDFVKLVESEIGRPVPVDKPELEEEGISLDTPIRVQVRDLPLRSALKLALGQFNLTFVWENGSIRITSKLRADNELETRLYPVRDLLPGADEELQKYADELHEIVEEADSPNTWSSVGGAGEIAVFARERVMVVHQTAPVHAEIEHTLRMLRTGKNAPWSDDEARILQALTLPVTCDLENMELQAAALYFSDLAAIPSIVLDRPSLEEEGVIPESPVSLRVHNQPLRQALAEMLSKLNLTMLVKDDVLMITSRLQCDNEMEHRVYSVVDLLGSPLDSDALIEIIQSTVAPNSWSSAGGPATIQTYTPRSLFVINETPAVHDQIEQFLAALRNGSQPFESDLDRRLHETMNRTVSFDFRNTRIDEAVQLLTTQAGISNVIIDRASLEEEGVRPDLPLTLHGQRISLRGALRLALGWLNLGTDIRDGTALIASRLVLDSELSTRLYPVDDLLGNPPDPATLIELIENTIKPVTWETVGGAGTVRYFPPKRYLVVQNTSAVQSEVSDLLAQLRGQPLPTEPLEESIRRSLRSIFDWTFDEGTLEQLADRLSAGLNCTVVLDRAGLEEEGVTPMQPVTVVARNEPLENALKRALEQIGVTYAIQDEAVIFTSLTSDGLDYHARAYSVGLLLRSRSQGEELAEIIQQHVSPESWSVIGGQATAFYFPPTGHLVVNHDEPHHRLLQQFLANLAAGRDNRAR